MKTQSVISTVLTPSASTPVRGWFAKSLEIVDALSTGRAAKEAYDAQVARGEDPASAVRQVFSRAA